MEGKINELLNETLKHYELPFNYEKARLIKARYEDDDGWTVETMFEKFNGTNRNHHNVFEVRDGQLYQYMFEDAGFPLGSVTFDRTLIPDEARDDLVKVARFDRRYHELLGDIDQQLAGKTPGK